MDEIRALKIQDRELPVPSMWRHMIEHVANSFVAGTFPNESITPFLSEYDPEIVGINTGKIHNYPDSIGALSERAWETSVCVWTGKYWEVLIDLSDVNGNTTDLVFHARIHEHFSEIKIEPWLIYVP